VTKIGLFASLLVFTSFSTLARETPRGELFGGYSFLHSGRLVKDGWDASLTVKVKPWLGINSDLSSFYQSQESPIPANPLLIEKSMNTLHTFLFGPQLTLRADSRVTLFGHLLLGVGHNTLTNEGPGPLPLAPSGFVTELSDTAFASALGGGLDIRLSD
jgi:hypothetical protein